MNWARTAFVLATVVVAYVNYPSWVDYPDPGSIAIILAICALWVVPYLYWYRNIERDQRTTRRRTRS